MSKAVNISVLVLLAAIAVGIFLRVGKGPGDDGQHKELKAAIAQLTKAVDENANSAMPMAQEAVNVLSRQFAELNARIAAIESRIHGMSVAEKAEDSAKDEVDPRWENQDVFLKYRQHMKEKYGIEPLVLSPELRKIADKMPVSMGVINWKPENFLERAARLGLTGDGELPEEAQHRITEAGHLFKARVELAVIQQRLYVQEVIDSGPDSRSYRDLSATPSQEEFEAAWGGNHGDVAVSTSRPLPNGLHRHYELTMDDYPQLMDYQHLCHIAKDYFVRDVDAIVKATQK